MPAASGAMVPPPRLRACSAVAASWLCVRAPAPGPAAAGRTGSSARWTIRSCWPWVSGDGALGRRVGLAWPVCEVHRPDRPVPHPHIPPLHPPTLQAWA